MQPAQRVSQILNNSWFDLFVP